MNNTLHRVIDNHREIIIIEINTMFQRELVC